MADQPSIASDRVTWMQPYWADLHRGSFFAYLARDLQAEALAAAVENDYPNEAAEIRQWNLATRRANLAILGQALRHKITTNTELWRVSKAGRELQCVAVYMPTGIDLRLLEGGEMRRTELFQDGPTLLERARDWRAALVASGWTTAA